jgi:hypothetical protein
MGLPPSNKNLINCFSEHLTIFFAERSDLLEQITIELNP